MTELIACESQGTVGRPKYVQDALKQNAVKVCFFVISVVMDIKYRSENLYKRSRRCVRGSSFVVMQKECQRMFSNVSKRLLRIQWVTNILFATKYLSRKNISRSNCLPCGFEKGRSLCRRCMGIISVIMCCLHILSLLNLPFMLHIFQSL